jgi:recombination DNA repair RAD52 pathway protein
VTTDINQTKVYEQLSEPFPQEMERTVNKSGTRLTYLPIAEVINRMNRVVGVGNWSSEILNCGRDATDPDWVVAHVRISARIGQDVVVRDGFGGQKIKRTRNGNEIVDLGDEFKGAVSDATKKALQQFGVGLYLARDAEAMEIEQVQDASQPDPQAELIAKLYENFKQIRENLSPDQLKQIKVWWEEYSGGRPVPRPAEFTVEELENLIMEATRLQLGGVIMVDDGND